MSTPIVYLRNIDYYTTEEELTQCLGKFDLKQVIIPNHTVALRSNKRKPLGIAYAEFANSEEAEKAIEEINNTKFKNRNVYAKKHIPFVPKPRRGGDGDETKVENNVNQDVSKDTIFIRSMMLKVSADDIGELFNDFNPQSILIYKESVPRKKFSLRNHHNHALVRLDTD